MSEWQRVLLREVTTKIGSGATPRGGKEVYQDAGISFIRSQNVHDGVFSFDGLARISDQAARALNGVTVRPGDVLLNITGESVTRTTLVPEGALPARVSQHVAIVRPDPLQLDSRFLMSTLLNPPIKAYLNALSEAGATRRALTKEHIEGTEILLPPLPEQRRIAAVLGSLDDLIETNDSLIHYLAELQVAMFSNAWDGQIRVRLAEVANVTMGQSPPGDTYNENAEGTPFYQGTRDFGWRFPTRRVWTTSPTRLAEEGDILVAVRAPVGRLNRATEITALGRGVGGLRARNRQATLFQALQVDGALWDMFQGTGTVFASINQADMRNLSIPWVEDDVLEQRVAALDLAIAELVLESQSLRSARDALLPLLMSGRVRVDERLEVPA